jgi:parvulin-like peptidyl-prolyl isomerase
MMKKWFPLFFIFFLLVPSLSQGKVVDQVAGVVGGDVITLSDVDAAMPWYGRAHLLDEGNPLDKEIRLREERKAVLEMLIEERLLQRVARQYNVKVEEEEINKTIEQMKQSGNLDDARLTKELAANGFTLEGYRHFLKDQIMRSRVAEMVVKPNLSMAEDKLREYYRNHAENYLAPQVRVSQILIQVPAEAKPKDWETAKARIEKVLQRIKKGEQFEKMAALYSDDKATAHSGGDLGFFAKGEMIPTLEAIVFDIEVGQVTGVIQSSQGLHLFKVTDKKPGSLPAFEDVKNRVMVDYYREELMRLYTKWLEDLKARSDVEIKL